MVVILLLDTTRAEYFKSRILLHCWILIILIWVIYMVQSLLCFIEVILIQSLELLRVNSIFNCVFSVKEIVSFLNFQLPVSESLQAFLFKTIKGFNFLVIDHFMNLFVAFSTQGRVISSKDISKLASILILYYSFINKWILIIKLLLFMFDYFFG